MASYNPADFSIHSNYSPDVFSSDTNPTFLNQYERKLATDISGAFDANRAATERQQARYGAPALSNEEDQWGIARANALANGINNARMNQERINAWQQQQQALLEQMQKTPVQSYTGPTMDEILKALGAQPNNQYAQNGTNWAQGLAGIASLMGAFGLSPAKLLNGLFGSSGTSGGAGDGTGDMYLDNYLQIPQPSNIPSAPYEDMSWLYTQPDPWTPNWFTFG